MKRNLFQNKKMKTNKDEQGRFKGRKFDCLCLEYYRNKTRKIIVWKKVHTHTHIHMYTYTQNTYTYTHTHARAHIYWNSLKKRSIWEYSIKFRYMTFSIFTVFNLALSHRKFLGGLCAINLPPPLPHTRMYPKTKDIKICQKWQTITIMHKW